MASGAATTIRATPTALAAIPATGRARRWLRRHRFELILLTPLLAYSGLFAGYFVVRNVLLSFSAPPSGGGFPTLASYREAIGTRTFTEAIVNTLAIALISVTIELFIGLGLALLAAKVFRGVGLFRALLILPLGIPGVVAATNMRYLFAGSGYVNEVVHDLTGLLSKIGIMRSSSEGVEWLNDPIAMFTVAITDVWKVTPLVMLILLAGLLSIDQTLYEAARIDGATPFQQLRFVTLPLLKPALLTAGVVRGIDALRIFVQPLSLGVSGQVPVLSGEVFTEFQAGDTAPAAASSVMLACIIAVIIFFVVRIVRVDVRAR